MSSGWLNIINIVLSVGEEQYNEDSKSECPDVKNYKCQLNPVWHRMPYSCTHMSTVGVKGLTDGCGEQTTSRTGNTLILKLPFRAVLVQFLGELRALCRPLPAAWNHMTTRVGSMPRLQPDISCAVLGQNSQTLTIVSCHFLYLCCAYPCGDVLGRCSIQWHCTSNSGYV